MLFSRGMEEWKVGSVYWLGVKALPGDSEIADISAEDAEPRGEDGPQEEHERYREKTRSPVERFPGGGVPVWADEGNIGKIVRAEM